MDAAPAPVEAAATPTSLEVVTAAAAAPGAAAVAVEVASPADAPAIFALINDAYQVETGTQGVAFKKTPRLDAVADVEAMMAAETLVKATRGGALVGAMAYSFTGAGYCYFGPFAVDRRAQGAGVGRALLRHVEAVARGRSARGLEITVVCCRSDILPMYIRDGFVEVGEEPFPDPWRIADERRGQIWMRVLRKDFA